MQCTNCGHELVPGAEFCGNCGAKLILPATTAAPPQPANPGGNAAPIANQQVMPGAVPGQVPANPAPAPQQFAAQPQPAVQQPLINGYPQPPAAVQAPFQQGPPNAYAVPHHPNSGFSIAALVLGILSLLSCLIFFFAIPLGILAIIFGLIGMSKGGKSMAIAGISCAAIGIVATIIITAVAVNYDNKHPENSTTNSSSSSSNYGTPSTQTDLLAPLHLLEN